MLQVRACRESGKKTEALHCSCGLLHQHAHSPTLCRVRLHGLNEASLNGAVGTVSGTLKALRLPVMLTGEPLCSTFSASQPVACHQRQQQRKEWLEPRQMRLSIMLITQMG